MSMNSHAGVVVKTSVSKKAKDKVDVMLQMKNTFGEPITSARATVFLIGDEGKVVGQTTKWVIGAAPGGPALRQSASTTYHVVFSNSKPFSSTKIIFNKIVLQSGQLGNPSQDVVIESK